MSKRRLLLVSDFYWPVKGGMEQAEYALASLVAEDYALTIATHSREPRDSLPGRTLLLRQFAPYRDPSGNAVVPLVPSPWGRIMMSPLLLWNVPYVKRMCAPGLYDLLYPLYRAAFRGQFERLVRCADLVHCYSTSYCARLTSDICRLLRVPLVLTPAIHFGRWGDSPGQITAYGNADALICFSEFFRRRMKAAWKRPVRASLELIAPPSGEPRENLSRLEYITGPYILFLGRREAHKGLMMLLSAFLGLQPTVSLVIAGPGPKIDSRDTAVTDLGEVDDTVKARLLSHCELFCLPSTDETFGIVYAEAMSYGKPVVALDVPPVNEIVLSGHTGLLVEPGNVGALRSALARLLTDEGLRAKMGERGRERFTEHFCDRVIFSKMNRVYQRLSCGNFTR